MSDKQQGNGAVIPALAPEVRIKEYFRHDLVMENFAAVLGGERQARAYIMGVLLAVASNEALQACAPASIYVSAMRAATLHISVDPSTRQGYLVPYKDKCTLVVGYKGLQDMAIRTGRYRYINTAKVHEGQVVTEDPISGEIALSGSAPFGAPVIGWLASFELLPTKGQTAGFRKTIYMTLADIHTHAEQYSKAYNSSTAPWKTATEAMERKTVLRRLLGTWGYLDPADVQAMDAGEETGTLIAAPEISDAELVEQEGARPQKTAEEIVKELGY